MRVASPALHTPPVLPPAHRMRRSADFSSAVRRGRRVRRGSIVVHQTLAATSSAPSSSADAPTPPGTPAVVGFVVGKAVGNSVVRHRVSRRLRAVFAARLGELPAGSATVVRALPEAASARSARLAGDVDEALRRLLPAGPTR